MSCLWVTTLWAKMMLHDSTFQLWAHAYGILQQPGNFTPPLLRRLMRFMFDWDLVQSVETCWTQWTQGQHPAAVLRRRPLRFLYKCCTNNPEIGLKRSCSFTSAYDSALTLCGTLTGDEEKQATRLQEKWARTYQRGANETMWLYVSSRQPVELALLEGLGFSWKTWAKAQFGEVFFDKFWRCCRCMKQRRHGTTSKGQRPMKFACGWSRDHGKLCEWVWVVQS